MDPTLLPWWGWLLAGVVGAFVGFVLSLFAGDDKIASGCGCLGALFMLVGALCMLVGLIRFVKWVWSA